ncbi:MAG: bL35 family ribosomal protein [Candidatus Gracilibacteria bacterium]|jgi:ribosomal protein L35
MKLKSHSGIKKRVKIRKSGKISFNKAGKRHLLINKNRRQKNKWKDGMPVTNTIKKHIRSRLPGKKII